MLLGVFLFGGANIMVGYEWGELKGRELGYKMGKFETEYRNSNSTTVELAPGYVLQKDTLKQILIHHRYFRAHEHRFEKNGRRLFLIQ